MPWRIDDKQAQRWRFMRRWLHNKIALKELCRIYGISRKTAYKWRQRFESGGRAGLVDSSRAARSVHNRPSKLWLDRLRRMRQRHPKWGAPKLRWALERRFGAKGVPSEAAVSRWLKAWGMVRRVSKRGRRGPQIPRPHLTEAQYPHQVLTVDFKGWFRTGDGRRVEPLTVRDLFSRYILAIVLLPRIDLTAVKRCFTALFRRHGLPEVIRSDNGNPFGSRGPLGLTSLSAWWCKLGIRVEFMTPGTPGENAGHEQMHKVYKDENLCPPARTLQGHQRRTNCWVEEYNRDRPHEGLGMQPPVSVYRSSTKRLPAKLRHWQYPPGVLSRLVKGLGSISLHGHLRYIGEAFEGERVGLRWLNAHTWTVYFGPLVIGVLDAHTLSGIRPSRYCTTRNAAST